MYMYRNMFFQYTVLSLISALGTLKIAFMGAHYVEIKIC